MLVDDGYGKNAGEWVSKAEKKTGHRNQVKAEKQKGEWTGERNPKLTS